MEQNWKGVWRDAWKENGRKMEERLEIANNLKSLGVDITAIHKATGLSPEEIEKL